MKYVSIDIETTGLVDGCQVLEVGAVLENTDFSHLATEIRDLPYFRAVIVHEDENYYINSYCMRLHKGLFEEIDGIRKNSTKELSTNLNGLGYVYGNRDLASRLVYCRPEQLNFLFSDWLRLNDAYSEKGKVVAAGKNFYAFDHRFLKPMLPSVTFHHRAIDPAAYYMHYNDLVPPEMPVCCERAGFKITGHHTALEDARTVIRLVRHGLDVNVRSEWINPVK